VSERTRVELLHLEGRIQRWIRFGRVAEEEILDRRRRALWFPPGAVFAFVRWAANNYGTAVSRIDILRACAPGEAMTSVPGVTPGGASLLRLSGWPRVERVLQAIDQVEALGVDPADACPDHWSHLQNRLTAGETPRAYTPERHRAWLLRRETAS
jgi:hypothetical protein